MDLAALCDMICEVAPMDAIWLHVFSVDIAVSMQHLEKQ